MILVHIFGENKDKISMVSFATKGNLLQEKQAFFYLHTNFLKEKS